VFCALNQTAVLSLIYARKLKEVKSILVYVAPFLNMQEGI
jgi:hypothetical protein